MTGTPGLAPLLIECSPEHVVGLPLHAALLVCYQVGERGEAGRAYDASLTELPRLDLLARASCVGLTLTAAGSGERWISPPDELPPETDGLQSFELRPDAPRRALLDLSDRLPRDLAPGEYDLALLYTADGHEAESRPARIAVRAPSAAEVERLSALGAPAPGQSWSDWTLAAGAPPAGPEQFSADDPARLERVLRWILRGPHEPARVDLRALDVLDGLYAPEAEALRAELLAARSADRRAPAARLRAAHPALAWWADEIEAGSGRITLLRAVLGVVPGE